MKPETKNSALSFVLAACCCLIGSFLSGVAAVQGLIVAGREMPSPGGGSFDLGPSFYFMGGCLGGLVVSSLSVLMLNLKFGRGNPWSILFALIITPVLAAVVSSMIYWSSR